MAQLRFESRRSASGYGVISMDGSPPPFSADGERWMAKAFSLFLRTMAPHQLCFVRRVSWTTAITAFIPSLPLGMGLVWKWWWWWHHLVQRDCVHYATELAREHSNMQWRPKCMENTRPTTYTFPVPRCHTYCTTEKATQQDRTSSICMLQKRLVGSKAPRKIHGQQHAME
jgi:hypothetical protein